MRELASPAEREDMLRAARASTSPIYCYSASRLQHRKQLLRSSLPAGVEIQYSVKANPYPPLLRLLSDFGADVASKRELATALECGFESARVSFVGPGKTDEELQYALDRRCGWIVIESMGEAERLNHLAEKNGVSAPILLRVNPREFVSNSGRRMTLAPSQFGVDEEQLPGFFARLKDLSRLELRGLHVFVQSHFLNATHLVENFSNVIHLARAIREEYPHQCARFETLDLGGGFGIPYFTEQEPLDLSVLQKLDLASVDFRLIVESGRFLVGECGFYVALVVDRKISRGRTYLILEGGVNHHLAAAGFGQPLRRNFPVGVLGSQAESRETVTLAGPTCYSMDLLAVDVEIPVAGVGDYIFLAMSGAYGPTFSPVNFLSHTPPGECLIE